MIKQKITIVANNSPWIEQELPAITAWFQSKVEIEWNVVHTTFQNIPFVPSADIGVDNAMKVKSWWYVDNVTKLALGSEDRKSVV